MSIRSVAGAVLLLAGFVSCKSAKPAPATADGAAAAPAPTRLTITATDYAFELPAQVPAGVVTIHLVNNGKEIHQAQLVRLDDGKTAADFGEAMKQKGPLPSWIKFVGGPNAVVPGGSVDGSVALSQGNYVVLCFHPVAGYEAAHDEGNDPSPSRSPLRRERRITCPGDRTPSRLPNMLFTQTPTLTPGHHTILVRNAGTQDHEVVLVKLPPGVTIAAFAKWTDGMKGEPPAMPVGGVTAISSGGSADFTVDLTAGDYAFICFVPDAKDEKPHFMHGMMTQFKVGA
jgi:hypothetical protein